MMRRLTRLLTYQQTTSSLPQFVQRPFTPNQWTSMTISHITALPIHHRMHQIVHTLRLMQSGIVPFSYDFFMWSCSRAIEGQQGMSKEELLLMVRLGCEYRIKSENFQKHIQNEMFLRIHRDYQGEIVQYDEQVREEQEEMMRQLEKKSMDYFELIKQGQQNEEDNENKAQTSDEPPKIAEEKKLEKKKTTNMREIRKKKAQKSTTVKVSQQEWLESMVNSVTTKPKTKQFSIDDLVEVSQLLIKSNSSNLSFLSYLLQVITIHFESQSEKLSPLSVVSYLRLIVHTLSTQMQQYQTNITQYTSRSVKNIYKYQFYYMSEHIRQLAITATALTDQQIHEVAQLYAVFPIKRRQIRKYIAEIVGKEVYRRQLGTEISQNLVDINRKDQKMKTFYRNILGLPQPIIEQSPQKQVQEQQHDQGQSESESFQEQLQQGMREQKQL